MTFLELTCPHEGCGITFQLTDGYVSRRREDHRSFYCPNGHPKSYQNYQTNAPNGTRIPLRRTPYRYDPRQTPYLPQSPLPPLQTLF